MTLRDSYLISRMSKYIKLLVKATVFPTIDANSGYWKLREDENDEGKTLFATKNRLYRYTQMIFRLKNAPATLQRSMTVILETGKWQYVSVYARDVFILSMSPENHIRLVPAVLRMISYPGIALKLNKFHFFSEAIAYLWHVVTSGKLQVVNKTKNTIEALKYPTSTT